MKLSTYLKQLYTGLICTGLLTTLASAEESEWKLSIGANYRGFKDIRVKSVNFNGGGLLDGSVTGLDTNNDNVDDLWHYVVASSLQQVDVALLDQITYTQGNFSGGTDRIDDGVGIILKAATELWKDEKLSLNLDFSLATAYTESGSYFNATATNIGYDLGESWNNAPFPGGGPDPSQLEKFSANFSLIGNVASGNGRVAVRSDLDLALYTFGLGVSANYKPCESANLFAGVGPTVTVVDYEVDNDLIGYWADGSGTFYNENHSEDEISIRAGLYAEVGVEYQCCESASIGLAARYDYIPVELNNDLAELDISGLSGQLYVSWEF